MIARLLNQYGGSWHVGEPSDEVVGDPGELEFSRELYCHLHDGTPDAFGCSFLVRMS